MQSEKIHGLEIKYRQYGDQGPLVFLIHGFGGGPQDFDGVVAHLQQNCRVIVPSVKVFFSHKNPYSFSEQVDCLVKFISNQLKGREEVFHVMGASYGATLSLGVRARLNKQVLSHTLVNPMPFDPLARLRNPFLKLMMNFHYIPGGLSVFLKTPVGVKTLQSLGKVFHMGLRGQDRLKFFNLRKLNLIEKALQRFVWISQNEDWKYWWLETSGRFFLSGYICHSR